MIIHFAAGESSVRSRQKCSRFSCHKNQPESSDSPRFGFWSGLTLSRTRSANPELQGYLFSNRWFCSAECLEWALLIAVQEQAGKSPGRGDSWQPKIGTYLVLKGFITGEQLEEALQHQKRSRRKLGEELVDLGLISERELIVALSEYLKLPWMDEPRVHMEEFAFSVVPKELCRRFKIFPLQYQENWALTVAIDHGFEQRVVNAIRSILNLPVQLFMTYRGAIQGLIDQYSLHQQDNLLERVAEGPDSNRIVIQRILEKFVELRAQRASLALFDDLYWVRYSRNGKWLDYFIEVQREQGSPAVCSAVEELEPAPPEEMSHPADLPPPSLVN